MEHSNHEYNQSSSLGRGFRTLALVIIGFFVLVLGITLLVETIPITSENSIALIRIEGVILDPNEIIDQIELFSENPSVQAIVVRIDSPGGAVVPSQEIYAALKQVRDEEDKTIVTSMGNMAASGGYYIASASNRIVANPGTITGSIGVIMEMTNVEELLTKLGVESIVVKSGLHKDLASPFRPLDNASRKILQDVMDDVHNQFIHAVADGRGMDIEKIQALADGRIFTGRQALEQNLVDHLGTLKDAIQLAADLEGISSEPSIIEIEPRFSMRDLLRTQLKSILSLFSVPNNFSLKFEFTL